ncbi:hypothetical protein D3870_14600 [Noviherbaspirillum cavernae]|uniref:Uncharacterized protein n=1 Tax=Noviherbaspirillum cavernae TaxID=2320862 RepID=A0A418X3L6_9BURK|nr:hypothetical protein [Noviherbaspirillum cavernae]RJG07062.1 hypothetical protein D3870_14600 [Noviherbaspirillum cavernae]
MTTKDHQHSESEKDDPTQAGATHTPSLNASRRHFAKAGLAASGVLITLASRPVIGAAVSKSPSGFLSGNQSSHGQPVASQGRSPGYWKNHLGSWPVSTDTQFNHVFGCSPTSVYGKYTLLELLSHKKDDKHNLGMHLVAAFLNARKGWTPFLREDRIKDMFTEWQSRGAFSPIATVDWNASEIVNYLQATQS